MVHIKVLVAGDEESNSTVLEVPDDVPAFRLLSTMVTKLHLPAKDPQGNLIDYTITHNRTGRILKNSETLAGAGVGEEDSVTLAPHIIMGGKPARAEKQAVVEPASATSESAAPAEASGNGAPAADSLAATIARALAKEQAAGSASFPELPVPSPASAETSSPAGEPASNGVDGQASAAVEEASAPVPDLDVADELDSLSEAFSEASEEPVATAASSNGARPNSGAPVAALPATTIPLSLEELAGASAPGAPQVVEQPEAGEAAAQSDKPVGRSVRAPSTSSRTGRASDLNERLQRSAEASERSSERSQRASARPARAAMSMDTPSASRKLNGPVPAEVVARLEEYRADENRWKALSLIFLGAIFGILLTVATADPFVTPSRIIIILLVIAGMLAIICWFAGRDYSKRAERLKQSVGSSTQDLAD